MARLLMKQSSSSYISLGVSSFLNYNMLQVLTSLLLSATLVTAVPKSGPGNAATAIGTPYRLAQPCQNTDHCCVNDIWPEVGEDPFWGPNVFSFIYNYDPSQNKVNEVSFYCGDRRPASELGSDEVTVRGPFVYTCPADHVAVSWPLSIDGLAFGVLNIGLATAYHRAVCLPRVYGQVTWDVPAGTVKCNIITVPDNHVISIYAVDKSNPSQIHQNWYAIVKADEIDPKTQSYHLTYWFYPTFTRETYAGHGRYFGCVHNFWRQDVLGVRYKPDMIDLTAVMVASPKVGNWN